MERGGTKQSLWSNIDCEQRAFDYCSVGVDRNANFKNIRILDTEN